MKGSGFAPASFQNKIHSTPCLEEQMHKRFKLTGIGLFPLFAVMVVVMAAPAMSGTFYLDPDTTRLTSGIGSEYVINIKIDAGITSLKLWQVQLTYDKLRLDTVSIVEGPLMPGVGTTAFHKYIENDSTILRLESVLFGYGVVVNGPGTLATIRFRAIGTGTVHLDINSLVLKDGNGNIITATPKGAVIYVNAPPADFGLINPAPSSTPSIPYEDSLRFLWHKSFTPYLGDYIRYNLYYSTDPGFAPAHTITLSGLSDTSKYVHINTLAATRYYWKVKAYSTLGYETWSTPSDGHFDLTITYLPPTSFSLIAPEQEAKLTLEPTDNVTFLWHKATTPYGGDYIRYDIYYSTDPGFNPLLTSIVSDLSDTTGTISASGLATARYYWKVKAKNTHSGETWSIPTGRYFDAILTVYPQTFSLLSPDNGTKLSLPCISQILLDWENAGTLIPNDTITYHIYFGPTSDLPASATFDTTIKTISQIALAEDRLPIRQSHYWRVKAVNRLGYDTLSVQTFSFMTYIRGDADGNGKINLLDVSFIINLLYRGGTQPLIPVESGDPDGDGKINLRDVSYIINDLYRDGPLPVCP
jgi:hypothetical protein